MAFAAKAVAGLGVLDWEFFEDLVVVHAQGFEESVGLEPFPFFYVLPPLVNLLPAKDFAALSVVEFEVIVVSVVEAVGFGADLASYAFADVAVVVFVIVVVVFATAVSAFLKEAVAAALVA